MKELDVAGGKRDVEFDRVSSQIESVARALAQPLNKIGVSRASITFGLAFTLESGAFTALLVKGAATGNVQVTFDLDVE